LFEKDGDVEVTNLVKELNDALGQVDERKRWAAIMAVI